MTVSVEGEPLETAGVRFWVSDLSLGAARASPVSAPFWHCALSVVGSFDYRKTAGLIPELRSGRIGWTWRAVAQHERETRLRARDEIRARVVIP